MDNELLTKIISESTCQKRVTFCAVYDAENNLLSVQSNRCNPANGICSRLGITQGKSNYDVISDCNWTHAEQMALSTLPVNSIPYKSVLYGHDFYCGECEKALISAGIKELEINKDLKINK